MTTNLDQKIIDAETIKNEVGPAIERALVEAHKIAAAIVDDGSRDNAIAFASQVRDHIDKAEDWRIKFYEPVRDAAENLRGFCDPFIKDGKAVVKTILSNVSEYNIKKEREARLARERAEAEARRIQEEAERKRQEAEAAERRAKEAAEAEAKRKKEAEEAEARRIQAEEEAKIRREREAREAAVAEQIRKAKEEEDARLAQAQVAHDVGNGPAKVDSILETQTAMSPVLASPQVAPDRETLRIEQELAQKTAAEKAEKERLASEAAEKARQEAEAAAAKARDEATAAAAAAKAAAQAAASTAVATRPNPNTTSVIRWKYDLDSDGTCDGDRAAFLLLAKAVAEGRAPVEYLGYDNDHPEKFRPEQINKDVQRLKERFSCPGIKAYPQQDEQLTRRKVGGRR